MLLIFHNIYYFEIYSHMLQSDNRSFCINRIYIRWIYGVLSFKLKCVARALDVCRLDSCSVNRLFSFHLADIPKQIHLRLQQKSRDSLQFLTDFYDLRNTVITCGQVTVKCFMFLLQGLQWHQMTIKKWNKATSRNVQRQAE